MVASRHEDVARLDVAMHQPARMSGIEGVGDLGYETRRALWSERAAASEQPAEIDAVDVTHGDVQQSAVFADLVHRNHVWVLDLRSGIGFLFEASAEGGVGCQLWCDQLDRDESIRSSLTSSIHQPHATTSEHALDAVATELLARPQLSHAARLGRGLSAVHSSARLPAWRCSSADDFARLLRGALALDRPSLIVVPIDYSIQVAISDELGAETVAT